MHMWLKRRWVKDSLEFRSACLSAVAQTLRPVPPLAPRLHSFSWKLFTVQATDCLPHDTRIHRHSTSFAFLAPIFDITPALTCKPSVCHLAASGVHSLSHSLPLSFCFPLSLPPPATSAVAWRAGGERRAEETGDFARSKYSLYACGVLSSKERRDRVHFLLCECVCNCLHIWPSVH